MDYLKALSILNIHTRLDEETLKKEYRNLVHQYHPDKYQTYQEQIWASNHFIKLTEAYQLLLQYLDKTVSPTGDIISTENEKHVRTVLAESEEEASPALTSLFQMVCFGYERVMLMLCGTTSSSGIWGFLVMALGAVAAIALLPYIHLVFVFAIVFVLYGKFQRVFLRVGSWLIGQEISPGARTLVGQVAYLTIVSLIASPVVYITYQTIQQYAFSSPFSIQSFKTPELFILAAGCCIFLITFYEWLSGMYAMWLRVRLRSNMKDIMTLGS